MGKTLGYGEITVANMTEPFTVMLTNEAQQFATDSNRKVTSAQSYYTDIIVIRGSQERTDYTIGNITSGSGIAVSKSSKRVTFSVSAGTTIGADAGVIEIPITLDGQTVKKQFSWSCGKQGPQGVQGIQGNDGNSFAWNMLSETNCGKKHWGTMSSGGKYSVEDFITEDNINAVKLICTESVSSSEWSYTCFTDLEMLKQLKPSTKYTLSYDIKANRSGMISHTICRGNITNSCTNTVVVSNIIGDETWQHISVVLTTNDLKTTPTNEVVYLGRTALSKVGYSIIKNLKLAEGDIDTPWSPSQSDIEGKGVAEIVQYYLTTSQASGVTSSTSGWSTDITTQKLTADKKYLWNCYQTRYSDGTSEPISTPKVIGVYGDKGQKGDNAKNLSITPSSQYFKSTDGGKTFAPNAITIKPTIQGEISFGKWQYSIDGGVSFADVVSGQKGLTVSNNVLAVSKDSSLYSDAVTMVTFRAVANDSSFYDTCSIAKIYDVSDIGDGRNLWITRDDIALQACTKDKYSYTTTGTSAVCIGADTSSVGTNKIALQLNNKYTISFVIAATSAVDNARWYFCTSSGGKGVKNYGGYTIKLSTGDNIVTQTITLDTACDAAGLVIYNLPTGCIIKDIQVEKGSSPTGWTPAPEDVQTAILSTKSEISSVSSKVDQNTKSIENRVEKTTYEKDLTLVKGDISKANEGLNKWRYEIYPKSLFTSEYQGKSTMDVFAKNTNLTPSQSVLINDTDLSIAWNYDNNYIGYALTFAKFSAAKSVAITFAHDDGAHIYLNGKLIGGGDAYNQTGESLTLGFVKGWNCIEVVVNEGASTEGFKLGTTISAISECQLMNCYYGTPVARQSHITNQLVENTTNIDGVSGSVQRVMSTVGGSGKIDEFVNNYSTWKKKVDGIETRVGETYTTKDDFNGLEIGGRNLLTKDDCNMSKWQNLYPAHCKITNNDYSNHIDYVPTGGEWEIIYKKISVTKGQKYILSFDYKVNKAYNYLSGQKYGVYLSTSVPTNAAPANIIANGQYVVENTVTNIKRGMITFTATVDTLYIVINGGCIDDNQTGINFEFNKWKLEKGNKPTDWTPAPEDVNGKIVNVETIANQTAKKFEWIVKGGDKSSSMVLTDDFLNIVANKINLNGKVTFNSFNQSLKDTINNKTNVSYLSLNSGGDTKGCWKIATISIHSGYVNQEIIIGANHRHYGYTECRIKFQSVDNEDPDLMSFRQTGQPSKAWEIIKTAASTWDLYLWKTESWDSGRVTKFDNPYDYGPILVTWSGENADLPSGTTTTEQMIADQTTIDGGIITTGYISADRIDANAITADKIATDAIKSRNYISSGGTQGSFLNLSDGSFTSPNLSWDSNGNLIAKNANISGKITAIKGSIGGWNIDNYSIYTTYDADQNIFGAGISGTKGKYVLWAGETNNAIGANRSSNTPTDASLVIYNNGGLEVRKSMVGNDKKNHLYTTLLQSGQINLKMDDNYIGTITATDTISSNSTVTMSHVSMVAKKGYGWSILHTNESGSLISDIQRDPGDTKIKINSPITVSSTDITKYNAIETTGDVVVSGKIHANYGSNKIQLNPDNNGSIELYGYTPFIDFHYGCSNSDYTSRIIAQEWGLQIVGTATVTGDLYCNAHIYTCTNGHFSWDGQTDAYLGCGNYSGGNNIYYYANYHAFYVNNDSGSGMMYINTNGVTSRVGFTKTSDERIKKNFESFDDNIIDAYMNIKPVKYQLKQGVNDKYHFGFKAQHVDKVFSDYGKSYNESFDICTSRPIDSDKAKELYGVDNMTEEYGLRYDELIAPTTYIVQHIYKELEQTKQEKANLETRLQAIEAKLGL